MSDRCNNILDKLFLYDEVEWRLGMALLTVYHGGYQAVEKPEIRARKNTKDFGTGFYCTIIKACSKDGQDVTMQKLYQYMM